MLDKWVAYQWINKKHINSDEPNGGIFHSSEEENKTKGVTENNEHAQLQYKLTKCLGKATLPEMKWTPKRENILLANTSHMTRSGDRSYRPLVICFHEGSFAMVARWTVSIATFDAAAVKRDHRTALVVAGVLAIWNRSTVTLINLFKATYLTVVLEWAGPPLRQKVSPASIKICNISR